MVLACAGCVTAPSAPPVPPAQTAPAPAIAAPTLPATYRAVDWSALPGWADDPSNDAWPAYLAGCAALTAPGTPTRDVWIAPCTAAAAVTALDAASVRAYFEAHFIPYAVGAADGRDSGLVTGYYEPLLAGSRNRTTQFAVALYAPPDDLLTIDLAELYPDLKDRRLRGRVDGRRVIPYWSRADIDAGRAPLDGKALVYVADPVEAFFLQIQGSGRIEEPDGSVIRIGYADQNGHPFRSIARVLIDRGEISADRASMQGIKAWARANPAKLPALLEENPSYVFFREVAPAAARFARGQDRRPDRHARRSARGGAHDRRRPALGAAWRARVSRDELAAVDDAARPSGAGAGHGGRDPRRDPRRFLLGIRARCGPRSGPDASGRPDVDPLAEGRGVAARADNKTLSPPGQSPACASTPPACLSAWYDERTSAPTAAWRKPIAYASRSNIANVSGCT